MKKFLILGFLILVTACQPAATPTAVAPLFPTATPSSTPIPLSDTPAPTVTAAGTDTPFPQFFTDQFESSLAGWVILQAGNEAVDRG